MRPIYKALMGGLAIAIIGFGAYAFYDATHPDVHHNLDSSAIRVDEDRLTQIDYDDDSSVTFGVVSDIHGEVDRARLVGAMLAERGASYILVPGDIANNEELRSGTIDTHNDEDEIVASLEALAETRLPILVIPGNHERREDWEAALERVTPDYPNVLDMARYRVFDGDDVDVVSLPGYQVLTSGNQRFIPDDGFYASQGMTQRTGRFAQGLDDPIFLLTHGAGRTGSPGPATIYSGEDVGDNATTKMMYQAGIRFAIVGHIHEAAGLATTLDGRPVPEGEFVDEFVLNVGTLMDWRHIDGRYMNGSAALVTVEGNQAKYDMIFLE